LAKEEKLPAWENIWSWTKEKMLLIWDKIYLILNKEVEHRKPATKQELIKETEEIKQEIKEQAPSLWQRLKDLTK